MSVLSGTTAGPTTQREGNGPRRSWQNVDSPDPHAVRVTIQTVLILVVVWLVWGAIYALQLNFVKRESGFLDIAYFAFSDAVIWALLTPVVLKISRVIADAFDRFAFQMAAHIFAGAAIVALHNVLDIGQSVVFAGVWPSAQPPLSAAEYVANVIPHVWYSHLLLYAAMVCMFQVLDHRRRLNRTHAELAAFRTSLVEARLDALRSQLQPHFLFNCLNTISGLVELRSKEARKMISNLAILLRAALETDAAEIPLRQEMKFVNAFLDIERVRFGPRLQVHVSIADGCSDAIVPTFILQPLIENAVQHGFRNSSKGGNIEVKAFIHEHFLFIEIQDDGVGMAVATSKEGIGLSLTRRRLREHYQHAELFVESAPGCGTKTILRLPYTTCAEDK